MQLQFNVTWDYLRPQLNYRKCASKINWNISGCSRFYCKTGVNSNVINFLSSATSFAITYCNTGLKHLVSETVKIPFCLPYLIDF